MDFEEFAPNLTPMTPEERTDRITMKLGLIKGMIGMMCNAFDNIASHDQLDAKGLMALGTLLASLGERIQIAARDLGDTVAEDMIASEMREMFNRIMGKLDDDLHNEGIHDRPDEEEDDGEDVEMPESFQRLIEDLEDMFGEEGNPDEQDGN